MCHWHLTTQKRSGFSSPNLAEHPNALWGGVRSLGPPHRWEERKRIKESGKDQTGSEADEDIQTQQLKIAYFETVINYLEGVLKQINNRTYHIKNALEHRRFEAGF